MLKDSMLRHPRKKSDASGDFPAPKRKKSLYGCSP
jgi:hypothetical protein